MRPINLKNKGIKVSLALASLLLCVTGAQQRAPAKISNDGYAEPGACASCHREIAESYARTAMARTFGIISSEQDFPELKAGSFQHTASEEFFTVYTRNGKPYLKRHQIGFDGAVTNVFEAQIDFSFGSGKHARSYISRTKSGELIELPLTWYAEQGGHWAMSPGYDRPDHAGFSRKLTYRCMSCHNAYIQTPTSDGETGTRFPAQLPAGIDCQRCHGPGQAHLDAVRQGSSAERVRSSIINPARLAPDRQMEACLQCHLETTSLKLPATLLRYGRGAFSYRPGEPLSDYILHFDRAQHSEERFEFASAAYRLRQSACYLKSRGALTCTSCHNPHEPSDTPTALRRYTEACQSCHQTTLQKLVTASRHPAAQDCAACHMPKRRPSDAIHTRVTDHLIQTRPAAEPTAPQVEKHDGNTPPYRGKVELYYPTKLEQTVEQELYLALAQIKHDANLAQGLPDLEAAITRHAPAQAEFYFELAEAYRRAGNLPKALAFYEQSCARAPGDWRYFYRLGATLTATQQPERAASALERARLLAPQEPAVLEAIANLLARRGKLPEAVDTLRVALALDPAAANIHSLLGARLFQLNDAKGAEQSWREAVRLRPEAATMRLNLANLLANNSNFREAQYHFKAALRSAPTFADAHLAYAIALSTHGDNVQAEQHLRETIKLAPNHFEAHLRLGQILHARGDTTRAAPHLRQAAESPEARIRDVANKLLN
jgi:predicted CXXCH cytochrome family protein